MRQFGGGILGGISLGANGDNIQNFRNIPHGPIKTLLAKIAFSLKSSAAAFALVVSSTTSAAAEGVDDLDLIMNAIISSLILLWDAGTQAFNLTPAQLRTVLGFLQLKDVLGTIVNAASVPISSGSATAFQVTFAIPVSLEQLFTDGNMFANGSERLQSGSLDYKTGATLTPSVVCANGTAVVSGVSCDLRVLQGSGDAGDVGNSWTALRTLNLPTVYQFGMDRPRLAILDTQPSTTNAATGVSIGAFELFDPTTFQQKYQEERLTLGGYDITQRCTPYLWPSPQSKYSDMVERFAQGSPRLTIASGVSSVSVTEIQVIGASETAMGDVSTKVGGGGEVAMTPITPHSLPPGSPVRGDHAPFLPIRIQPGARAPKGATIAANPQQAAQKATQHAGFRQTLLSLAKSARGGR